MFDPNWPRWIRASVTNHFASATDALGIKVVIEGQPRDTNDEQDHYEFRIDGPDSYEPSKNFWVLNIEVNLLLQSIIDGINIYRHDKLIGELSALFTSVIEVRRCGNEPEDDDSFVGCLKLLQNRGRDTIEISRFGQLEPQLTLEQTTIEGHYQMQLDLTN